MNIITRWHDLKIDRLEDGGIRLEQSDCGEDCVIYLHPEQALFIARQVCGMKPETAERIGELERRIAVLTDKLQNVVCESRFRESVLNGCSDGLYYLAKIDAVLDLALEFDGGRLEPEYRDNEQQEGHSASKPIYPPSAINQAKKTQHSAIVVAGDQLGLEV